MMNLANYIYENIQVEYSTPDFYDETRLDVNDQYFSNQRALNNSYGIDINALEAWGLLQNSFHNIKVAVIDDGVEPHEDFYYGGGVCKVLSGYTANGRGTGMPRSNHYHGQLCAGVLGAVHNNIGIAGVAPYAWIVPFRIFKNNDKIFSNNRIARAINKAWDDFGCDVLSNSWGGGAVHDKKTKAIRDAYNYGRLGKGCVVVFSSGNENISSVNYPASLSEAIAVGSVDFNGVRSSFSNYNYALELSAPGEWIYTTDRMGSYGKSNSNYYSFKGTSAACPHVSGVAALILSVRPEFTSSIVRRILNETAQKVGGYNYQITSGHHYGTWNSQTGYGVVDAYKALKVALGYDLYTRDNSYDFGGTTNPNTFSYDSPDIWLRSTADNDTINQLGFNGTNYLNVRVHNKGQAPSMTTDSLRVYYRRAELQNSNNWGTNYWYYGGVVGLPEIPAGGSVIVKIPVTLSTFRHFDNFAFYTRIDSDYDKLRTPETINTSVNINENNNISAKNTQITSCLISSDNFGLDANFAIPPMPHFLPPSQLIFDLSTGTSNILDNAEVTLIFPEDLMTDWTPVSENIKQLTPNTFLVTGETVEIPGVPETDITLRYNFLTRGNSPDNIFKNHITQYIGDDEELVGGLTIQIEKPERAKEDMFTANAGNDTTIPISASATLHATQINENATYRWYDKERNFLYEGLNYTVTPSETSEYILEVTAESDGYRDLDNVKVNVVPGYIRSITPNPVTDNWVTVSYEYATTVTSAHLLIYNTATTALVGDYDLSNLDNVSSLDIEVTKLPTGSYNVILVCDNAICHSKILIKQ